MHELIIATKNQGKIREFKQFLGRDINNISSIVHFDECLHVEETGNTFEENAQLKAEQIARILKKPVLADDSGLVIEALGGEPGIYSARYAGQPTDDKRNYEKVLLKMRLVPPENRQAKFIAVLALAIPGQETKFFTGICPGKIASAPLGGNGFGYDPIFIPLGYNQTMAELAVEVKNNISHRYHAILKLKEYLQKMQLTPGGQNESSFNNK